MPGLAAKAMVDVDLTVADTEDESRYIPALEKLSRGRVAARTAHGPGASAPEPLAMRSGFPRRGSDGM